MGRILTPKTLEIPFRTLGEAFNDYATQHPTKEAIHSIDQNLSLDFQELNTLVERTATAMLQIGVCRGDRVAILSGECVEKLILMFAAWRCGASACPFHAEITAGHLKTILATIKPRLTIWRSGDVDGVALQEALSCPSFSFSSLSEKQGFFANLPLTCSGLLAPGAEYEPYDEGCIFATSGTTDMPKCVVWDQLGLWLCGLSTIDFTGMTAKDRLLEYRTFSWLSPQIVTFMPFVALGLTIVIAKGFSRRNFIDWIRSYRITLAAGVPTVINMLLDDPVEFNSEDLKTLRLMTASSAPLAPERWRQFEAHYGIQLLQFYGASEGGWLCGNRHDRFKVGTAGPPAKHIDLAILDQDGNICPSCTEGEISIRGPQTATASITAGGDWEDRTEYRLHEWARVGDLGFMDKEGFITVTGRVKDLILRGGISIAPLEIDAALMTHPDVREAAVIGVPDKIWGEEIACYVVPAENANPSPQKILIHLAKHLPKFKLPKFIKFIDVLPKNDRGKVRREQLKDWWLKEKPK